MRHTLPAGVVGPGFNDEFGDTFGIIYGFTADGFTHRELRDYVEDVRSKLLHVRDVSKIEILGAQDEKIFVEFSMEELASLGIDRSALIAALQAQNVVQPAGTIQTGNETLSLRVSGAFRSEEDVANVNFAVGGRMLRLSDIARIRRGFADPPQPLFRVNGQPAIGLAIAMRDGGDILALGRNVKTAIAEATADLPLGIEPRLVADQAATVDSAISEFMTSLWQAVGIILVASFISLGFRPGLVIASAIPLTLVVVFSIMQITNIDMQRISLGALIIALALMVDDAMTTTDAMLTRLAQGDDKVQAATFAFRTYAFAMLAGTLVTIAGFVPVGFAASGAGEYTFSLFAVVAIALIVSWFVAVLVRTIARRSDSRPTQDGSGVRAGLGFPHLPRLPHLGATGEMADDRRNARDVCRLAFRDTPHSQSVLSGIRPAGTARRHDAAAKRFDFRERNRSAPAGRCSQGRSGRRTLEHQCRTRGDTLLSAVERAAPEQLLQPGRRRCQGRWRA
jgi:multidrug efflux pump subunit AcrB